MSKATGVLLIMAGLGVAAYELAAGPELSPELGQGAPSQHTDVAKIQPATPINLATVSMPERIDPPASKPAPAVPSPQPTTVAAAPASRPVTPPPTTAARASQPWPPFVTHVQLAQRESAPSRLPLPPPQKAAIVPGDRTSLAREIQRELRRVGCYDGEINATWTTSTRRAMKMFTDRVNATLPVEEPDNILLALVQSHPDNACGKPCPAGQGLSEAGRCLPNAILARAATKGSARLAVGTAPKGKAPEPPPPPAIVGWSTTTTVASPPSWTEPPEGRMALSGPRTEGQPTPAAPMPSAGVSVLPGPVPPAGVTERYRAPRHAQGSGRGSWAQSFYKQRRDTVY